MSFNDDDGTGGDKPTTPLELTAQEKMEAKHQALCTAVKVKTWDGKYHHGTYWAARWHVPITTVYSRANSHPGDVTSEPIGNKTIYRFGADTDMTYLERWIKKAAKKKGAAIKPPPPEDDGKVLLSDQIPLVVSGSDADNDCRTMPMSKLYAIVAERTGDLLALEKALVGLKPHLANLGGMNHAD
jgi:hypothetical protein